MSLSNNPATTRQEGCDSPLSAWDRETNQAERIEACDRLRKVWGNLLLEEGQKSDMVGLWEEHSVSPDYQQELRSIPSFRRFCQEGISYRLPMNWSKDEVPARLVAVGFPLEKSQIVLTIDKWFPFQFNDIVSEAKPAFLIGSKGSGVAFAASLERIDVESGRNPFYGNDMTLANVRNLYEAFQDGTFTVNVEPDTEPQWEKVEPKPGVARRLLGGVHQAYRQIFERRAA